jgi:hypothetical protein
MIRYGVLIAAGSSRFLVFVWIRKTHTAIAATARSVTSGAAGYACTV